MKEVTIFVDEEDLHESTPLHEYIMRYLMHHNIRGASIFAATVGFGHKHHLNRPRRLGGTDEGPLMILFIEEEQKVQLVLPHLKEVVRNGLIFLKTTEVA